jgi:hypothetical protein
MKLMTQLIASTVLFWAAADGCAAPGGPIGGIIVKGGKNPGGQMLALATTDGRGHFTIQFAEGGEYRLVLDSNAQADLGERMKAGIQLEYVIKSKEDLAAEAQPQAAASRRAPVRQKIANAQLLVTVPNGGGAIVGTLQQDTGLGPGKPTQPAVNDAGARAIAAPIKGGSTP